MFSRRKGTGKSTLTQLVVRLFGRENSYTQNSVSKLTSQFNLPLLQSKLIVCEELKLGIGSTAGNTLKTYITERDTTSEAKGKDLQRVRQCCAFMFTTNHFPSGIESDDRRYCVIEVDHDGHASGPRGREFGEFIAQLNAHYEDERNLAKLYNALVSLRLPNSFNAKTLNVSEIDTPIMRELAMATDEVVLDQLRELLEGEMFVAISQTRLIELSVQLRVKSNRLPHLMRDLSWRREQVKWGGVDYARTLYLKEGYSIDRGDVIGPANFRVPMTNLGMREDGTTEEEMEIIR